MKLYYLLNKAKEINTNENVNKIILASLLNQDLNWVYANLNISILEDETLKKYLCLVKRYADGFPLGYILGYVFFYGNKILVNNKVLIPRNETEILVAKTLNYSEKLFNSDSLDVLDLCAGSGCIAVSLALKKLKWNLTASDISFEALQVAIANKKLHNLNNLTLIESDLFSNLFDSKSNLKFNIIVCNPPYIDKFSNNYNIHNLKYEPDIALFAFNSGFFFYEKIFSSILDFLKEDFLIALEIGFDQKQQLENLVSQQFSDYVYWFEKDYSGHWRFLFISSKTF